MNTRNPYTDLNGKLNVTGENIKYYRIKKGLSAQQLSDKLIMMGLDIHRQAIFAIESGKRTVVDYELGAFAEILGVSTDTLLNKFLSHIKNENK